MRDEPVRDRLQTALRDALRARDKNVLAKVWAFFEGGHAGVDRAWPIAYRLPEEERAHIAWEASGDGFHR